MGEETPGPLTLVGPYQVLARLGAGGMGEVHLARRAAGGPLVAVKTVRTDLGSDEQFRDRFRREIEAARSVDGRYTARLVDGAADAEPPWLATEFVPAPTLDQAVRRLGPLPVATVWRLGLDLARALRSVHHAQVLHRDLKPSNVLLAADGPRVIDFGISRAFGASTLTATGALVGTPGFMSPEHVAGSHRVVAASDVFCLGSVLCHAVTGSSPFGDGPLGGVLYRVSQAQVDLSAVPDEALREVLAACLHRDPSARPDARELERRFAAGCPQPAAHPAEPDDHPWPAPLRGLISEHRRRAEDVLARHPVPPHPVSPHPASPPPTHPAGARPVAPVPPADPGVGPRAGVPSPRGAPGRRGPRWLLGALGLVTVLSLTGVAVGLLGGAEEPGGRSGDTADGGQRGERADDEPRTDRLGVDALGGVGRNRQFPVDELRRPAGWSEWGARLGSQPRGCALDSRLLVCRGADGAIQALDAADGTARWRVPAARQTEGTGPPGVEAGGGLATADDLVIFTGGAELRAHDTADGAQRWSKPLAGEPHGRLLVADGRVFLAVRGTDGIHLQARRLADGERLWSRPLLDAGTADEPGEAAATTGVLFHAVGVVYAHGAEGLTAYQGADGTPVAGTRSTPCPDGRLLAGEVFCPAPGGGQPRWLAAQDFQPLERPLQLPDSLDVADLRFHAVGSGQLTARDQRHNRMVSVRQDHPAGVRDAGALATAEDGGPAPTSPPVLVGERVVYADNDALYVLPPEGARVRLPIEGAPGNARSTDPAPEVLSLGGVVVVIHGDGAVRAVSLPD